MSEKLTAVFCACCVSDLETWTISSRYISQKIPSAKYVVIVPDDEVEIFRSRSAEGFQVVPETDYVGSLRQTLADIILKNAPHMLKRIGWYVQQFAKLSAIRGSESGDVVLIWDSDTLPLANLEFRRDDGRLTYYKGRERNAPYFRVITDLLDIEEFADFSFIAQCFPIRGCWAHEFFEFIEKKHLMPWTDAIISCIDFSQHDGFSEYETLGTFLWHTHSDGMAITENRWYRFGNCLVFGAANIEKRFAKKRLAGFDYVAFEEWDNPLARDHYKWAEPFLKAFNILMIPPWKARERCDWF